MTATLNAQRQAVDMARRIIVSKKAAKPSEIAYLDAILLDAANTLSVAEPGPDEWTTIGEAASDVVKKLAARHDR